MTRGQTHGIGAWSPGGADASFCLQSPSTKYTILYLCILVHVVPGFSTGIKHAMLTRLGLQPGADTELHIDWAIDTIGPLLYHVSRWWGPLTVLSEQPKPPDVGLRCCKSCRRLCGQLSTSRLVS